MTKLLLDMGAARSTALDLRMQQVDAIHVAEIGLTAASDERIVEVAAAERRVIVTFDLDFARILVSAGRVLPSVILVRLPMLDGPAVTQLLQSLLGRLEPELSSGCIVSVSHSGYRIRRLPVLPPEGPAIR